MDTLLRETVNAVVNSRFPELSIEGRRQIESIPTRLIVETLEPSIIYLFPRDMIQKLAKENWEINMFYQKILEYSLIVSQIKADSWRFESARERYNLLLETHPEIIKRAPLAYIASYLLMTPETLSRVRSGVL